MLFSYLLSAVYLDIILCTLIICTSSCLYIHTRWVTFWQPWICTSKYWSYIVQQFDETVRFWGAGVSP